MCQGKDGKMKKIKLNRGDSFEGWTVIGGANSSNKDTKYKCRCKCGKVKDVYAKYLINGTSKSCSSCAGKRVATSVISKSNASGVRGVAYAKHRQKYNAYITVKAKQYNLGYYNTLEEAASVRKEAEMNIDNFSVWYAERYPKKQKAAVENGKK